MTFEESAAALEGAAFTLAQLAIELEAKLASQAVEMETLRERVRILEAGKPQTDPSTSDCFVW